MVNSSKFVVLCGDFAYMIGISSYRTYMAGVTIIPFTQVFSDN